MRWASVDDEVWVGGLEGWDKDGLLRLAVDLVTVGLGSGPSRFVLGVGSLIESDKEE